MNISDKVFLLTNFAVYVLNCNQCLRFIRIQNIITDSESFSIDCRQTMTIAIATANQNKENITSQWELEVKTSQLPEARENGSETLR